MPRTLRFVLCGSVDDGKSTVLGRLLYDCGQVFGDELRRVEEDSLRYGTQGDGADLALLVDGLHDEREQGITIDVAYRAFETPRRRFIAGDAPGHELYTRNMATGASTADLAVVMVDGRRGVLPQTARHTRIVAMFGVRHVVLAVNKMDLVGWQRTSFEEVVSAYRTLADEIGVEVQAIPVSALTGDNVTDRSEEMSWYEGPTLLEHLETAMVEEPPSEAFRMPVQYVNRPNPDFRGYCGRVTAGTIGRGDRVTVSPAGIEASVEAIVVWQGERERARQGDSVTLTLTPQVDVTRGDVIGDASNPIPVADQFQAQILWMGDKPLAAGRSCLMKLHTREVWATVTRIKHRIAVADRRKLACSQLELNEIGVVNIATNRPVPFEAFDRCRHLGGFILIDRLTNSTVGAGTIAFSLMRAANLEWHDFDVDKVARGAAKRQKPRCFWFTGLSASGKSTIANLLEKRLFVEGWHTYLLDGDNVRHGLCRDLGFAEADRVENIRRVAEVARLLVDAGLVVIVSFISPFRAERDFARSLFEPDEFLEIFVDASFETCARRDPKGFYAKAMKGEIRNFTGLDSPYEAPTQPDLHLDTDKLSPRECVELLTRALG